MYLVGPPTTKEPWTAESALGFNARDIDLYRDTELDRIQLM